MLAKFFRSKIVRTSLYYLYVLIFVVAVLEIAYRFQVIDFYRAEINTLNPDLSQPKRKRSILVFGDSFTVQSGSWLNRLRAHLPDDKIMNAAITGSSIVEAAYIAPGRIRTADPDIFIYQIYVGNDLLGITHQLNWREWSVVRNLYWCLSDRIHILPYLNYKMGQVHWGSRATDSVVVHAEESILQKEKFDASRYRQREKMYAQGDPMLISNSVLLKNDRDKDLSYLLSELDDIISDLKPDCRVILLVIPHKAQVDSSYLTHMRDIGFHFDPKFGVGNENYPFVEAIENHFHDRANITVINPLKALAEGDTLNSKVYYLTDEHLSEKGQSIVKDLVLKNIGD